MAQDNNNDAERKELKKPKHRSSLSLLVTNPYMLITYFKQETKQFQTFELAATFKSQNQIEQS